MEKNAASGIMLALLIANVVALAFNVRSVEASTDVRMWVDPVSITAEPGQFFYVAIMVENVPSPGAALWQFSLGFDLSVLTVVNPSTDVVEGEWLGQDGALETLFGAYMGPLMGVTAYSFLTRPGSTTGSGVLAYITFKVIRPGYTSLHLHTTTIADTNSQLLTHVVNDGEFYTDTPRAEFEYNYRDSYFRPPIVGESITFNATLDAAWGRGSYDPNPGGAIVSYRWDFGDGTIETHTTPIATHSYAQSEMYEVTLTVTDNSVPSLTDSQRRWLQIDLRDIAITDFKITPSIALPGATVNISVTVTNLGTAGEYFNVTAYYDNTLIPYNRPDLYAPTDFCSFLEPGPHGWPSPALWPGESLMVNFTWNTSGLPAGRYTIRANASILVPRRFDTFFVDIEDETNNVAEGTVTITSEVITATADVDPDTLNLGSKCNWITAYIQLPEGCDAADIDVSSILLNGTVQPVLDPKYDFVTNSSVYLMDHNNDGILERMVKFNKTEVASWISSDLGIHHGNVALTITGKLSDETPFEATDTVKMLFPGDVDDDADVDFNDFIIVSGCYGISIENPSYVPRADFNEDGTIDFDDFIILAGNYGKTAV